MADTARFRSATDFPKGIEDLETEAANQLYAEMRDCLIFTNRSRAQLIRRNEEHKNKAIALRSNVDRLQSMIERLKQDKQALARDQQAIIAELEEEMIGMSQHLDQLSDAFSPIEGWADPDTGQFQFMAIPQRLFTFLRTVKNIVLAWRGDDGRGSSQPRAIAPSRGGPSLSDGAHGNALTADEEEQDRRDRPQMYEDQASINRSLLDR